MRGEGRVVPTYDAASAAACYGAAMTMTRSFRMLLCAALVLAGGCATTRQDSRMDAFAPPRVTVHRDGDDLLTAGLGLDGLRAAAPAFADPAHPTPAELRRRAIWSNWHGIADLTPAGGYGTLYGSTASVPGREFATLARVLGANLTAPSHVDERLFEKEA